MPPEAQKVEKTLRDVGLGKSVDKAVLSMNRSAEDAIKICWRYFCECDKANDHTGCFRNFKRR